MKIRLNFSIDKFKEKQPRGWWQFSDVMPQLLALIYQGDIIPFNYIDHNGRFQEIHGIDDVIEHVQGLRPMSSGGQLFQITRDRESYKNYCSIHFSVIRNISITFSVSDVRIEILEKLKQLVINIYLTFKDICIFTVLNNISLSGYSYPKKRKGKNCLNFSSSSLIDFVCFEGFNDQHYLYNTGVERLINDPLPPGVIREQREGLYIIQWVDCLEIHRSVLKKRYMEREDWLTSRIDTGILADFNELGDKKTHLMDLKHVSSEESFFSFTCHGRDIAFHVCVLNKKGRLHKETKAKIKHYLKTGRLDSGKEFDEIGIVVPLKERALSIYDEARSLGVHKVYYVKDKGNIWDIYPDDRNWQEYSPYVCHKDALYLRTGQITFKEDQGTNWWHKPEILSPLLTCFYHSCIFEFNYIYVGPGNFKKISALEDVLAYCAKLKGTNDSPAFFVLTHENTTLKNHLEVTMKDSCFSLNFRVDASDDEQLSKLKKIGIALYQTFKGLSLFYSQMCIHIEHFDYRRHQKMRDYSWLNETGVINFIAVNAGEYEPGFQDAGFDALFDCPLPDSAVREENDGLCIIQWAPGIGNDELLDHYMMSREDWIYEHINLAIHREFNEFGDKYLCKLSYLETLGEKDKFITHFGRWYYYDHFTGYLLDKKRKPITHFRNCDCESFARCSLNRRGKLNKVVKTKVGTARRKSQTSSGKFFRFVSLIVASREEAVAIYDDAKSFLVHKVYYTDEHDQLWDIYPKGNWRERFPYEDLNKLEEEDYAD